MDESQKAIKRGQEAQQVIDSPLYREAFAEIESELFTQWVECNMHDTDSQKEILRSVKNLRRLRAVLERVITNGEAASLLLRRSAGEKVRDFIGR